MHTTNQVVLVGLRNITRCLAPAATVATPRPPRVLRRPAPPSRPRPGCSGWRRAGGAAARAAGGRLPWGKGEGGGGASARAALGLPGGGGGSRATEASPRSFTCANDMQRGLPVLPLRVDIRAVPQQRRGDADVPILACGVQRRAPRRVGHVDEVGLRLRTKPAQWMKNTESSR